MAGWFICVFSNLHYAPSFQWNIPIDRIPIAYSWHWCCWSNKICYLVFRFWNFWWKGIVPVHFMDRLLLEPLFFRSVAASCPSFFCVLESFDQTAILMPYCFHANVQECQFYLLMSIMFHFHILSLLFKIVRYLCLPGLCGWFAICPASNSQRYFWCFSRNGFHDKIVSQMTWSSGFWYCNSNSVMMLFCSYF